MPKASLEISTHFQAVWREEGLLRTGPLCNNKKAIRKSLDWERVDCLRCRDMRHAHQANTQLENLTSSFTALIEKNKRLEAEIAQLKEIIRGRRDPS